MAEKPKVELRRTVILLQCLEASECVVHFEPEGATHVLREGDVFRVEAVLPPDREIEIAYSPGSIQIWAEQTWGTQAFNRAGEQLEL